MYSSVETSCMTHSLAKRRKSGSGDMGFIVPGSRGGGRGSGRSCWMLYQFLGRSSGSSVTLISITPRKLSEPYLCIGGRLPYCLRGGAAGHDVADDRDALTRHFHGRNFKPP